MSNEASVSRGFMVRGRVQGVGFRWWTSRQAERLGVAGRVRNLPDGTVEVMASGAAESVEALRTALEDGPPLARVDGIEDVEFVLDATVSNFSIA